MKDKFQMSQEDNIFMAKRNIVDLIYKEARLEGIAVTFPETNEIYEGRNVGSLTVEEVVKINNLKHAWFFLFDTLDYPLDIRYVCQLNMEIGKGLIHNPGGIRTELVSIGGTEWKPDIPNYDDCKDCIEAIMQSDISATEKAIDIMLYIMRAQMFSDGNKRTAQLAANQIMVSAGAGTISVPEKELAVFYEKLICFYETGNAEDIKTFLYEVAIDGINHSSAESYNVDKAEFYAGKRR